MTTLIHPVKDKVPKKKTEAKRKLIIKDSRLFTNSVKQLTDTLQSSGLEVKVHERDDEEVYELVVTVKKPIGGDTDG